MNPSHQIIIYSKEENSRCSRDMNSYFCEDFTANQPEQALVDFRRSNYFLNHSPDPQADPKKTIEAFVGAESSEEQEAIAKLLIARGGQALSAVPCTELCTNTQYSVKDSAGKAHTGAYAPICSLEVAFFSKVPGKENLVQRTNLLLHYLTIIPQLSEDPLMLDPQTRQLKPVSPEQLKDISYKISEVQRAILHSAEFAQIQKKFSSEQSVLILTKLIEEIVETKLGLVPLSFVCCKHQLTGLNKKGFKFHYSVFNEDKTQVNWNNIPDLRGRVISEQLQLAMGSNTEAILFNDTLIERNEASKTNEERIAAQLESRNIDYLIDPTNYGLDEDDLSSELNWVDEFKRIFSEIIDSILKAIAQQEEDAYSCQAPLAW